LSSSQVNAKLFINYRREDTRHAAGRLYDRLIQRFGDDQVFMDIDQIEPGEDFVEVINRKVGTCDIAIVAIGPHWLHATDESGKRRLDDEDDFVRMEIVAALQRNIRVIPVLVDGARMPGKHDLPEALAPLSRRNAIELSETRFHADVNRLIEAIEKSFAVVEKKAELSATPVARPAEPTSVRPPDSEDRTTPVRSTQTTPAIPPVVSGSLITALKEPAVWIRKRSIIVIAVGATVVMLLAITWSLTRPHPSVGPSEPSKPAEPKLTNQRPSKPAETQLPDQQDAATNFDLALRYYNGDGVSQDLAKAAELYQKSADQGNANAQANLGWLYEHGEGVPKDFAKAEQLYQKAADQGNKDAIASLKRLSRPAAPKLSNQGNAATWFGDGWRYRYGQGVPKDLSKAAELYQKAADQGHRAAQYYLGLLYEMGEGVPKDLSKAAELYQKAADQGDVNAQHRLKGLSSGTKND
jgi:TPR repeat protein